MTPSHSRKKGVRYRYYVSQAILQSRKDKAGAVFRVPAPDLEAQIEQLIRKRCPGARGDLRALIETQIAKVTIQPSHIEVSLYPGGGANLGGLTRGAGGQDASGVDANPADAAISQASPDAQIIKLPWIKKPFRAPKGIASEPSSALENSNKSKEATLRATGRARRWVDRLMAGEGIATIAADEGKGERQIRLLLPLAFLLEPAKVRDIIAGQAHVAGIMELARNVPLVWANMDALP